MPEPTSIPEGWPYCYPHGVRYYSHGGYDPNVPNAWGAKVDASYESFYEALAPLPYTKYALDAKLDNSALTLDAQLDNAAVMQSAQLGNGLALEQTDARENMAADNALGREINEILALQYTTAKADRDNMALMIFNNLLSAETWARNDWIKEALNKNAEAVQVMAASLKDILGRSVANPAVTT